MGSYLQNAFNGTSHTSKHEDNSILNYQQYMYGKSYKYMDYHPQS